MTRKAITYSLYSFIEIDQLASKQTGINKVVNKTKKIEIPSIPLNENVKFEDETQMIS